jgi:succinate dehydrogenase/fumarate reductase flavoprotein subunit
MARAEPAEVAVVGGGMAGLVAANRCAQLGLRTVLLEKGAAPDGDSNARISTGLFHLAWHPLDAPAGELEAALVAATDGDIEPGIARAIAANAAVALQWLISEGVTFAPSRDEAAFRWQVTPHGANVGRRVDGDRGTYRMVRVLYRNLAARGAAVHHASRVTAIAPSAAGWRLTVDGPLPARHIEAASVVLCDGGFQASREMVTRYIGPHASDVVLRAALTGTGDALRMGLAAGAAAAGLGRFYGHILSRDALHRGDLWPYPVLDALCEQGLIIDRWGRPLEAGFADGIQLANILARTEDPRGWSAVVTAAQGPGTQGPGRGGGPAPGAGAAALDHLERLGGTVCRAADAAGLAAALGLPAGRLADAVEQRLGRPAAAGALIGVPIVPGITVTMGGLAVRADGAVLADDGSALAGLFACGSAGGGIQGGPRGGYLGGLAIAAVTAWITAATIGRRSAR